MEFLLNFFTDLTNNYQSGILSIGSDLARVLSGSDGFTFAVVVTAVFTLIAIIDYMSEGDIVALLTGIAKKWLLAGAVLLVIANWGEFIKSGLAIDRYLSGVILKNRPEDAIINAANKMNAAFKADLNALSKQLEIKKEDN